VKFQDHHELPKSNHLAAPSRQGEKHRWRFAPADLSWEVYRHGKTGENSRPIIGEDSTPAHTWRDNVFVERLWRSIKYEEVYLRAYDSVSEARASIGRYLDFYNARRPHSSLDGLTPDQAYFDPLPLRLAA
jgi:transposase InsO family protein